MNNSLSSAWSTLISCYFRHFRSSFIINLFQNQLLHLFSWKICFCWEHLSAITSGNDLLRLKFCSVGVVLVTRENWAWVCFFTAWRIISVFIILYERISWLNKILLQIPFDRSIRICIMHFHFFLPGKSF